MTLRTTEVSRCLDKRLEIGGFELPDLIALSLIFAVLNFVGGLLDYRIAVGWVPTLVLALVLRMTKRGKPDGYFMHLLLFHSRSKNLNCFGGRNNVPY